MIGVFLLVVSWYGVQGGSSVMLVGLRLPAAGCHQLVLLVLVEGLFEVFLP